MTPTQFIERRDYGLIGPDEPVRTIIFQFPGGHQWEEIFVQEYYSQTIAQQEADFRAKMSPLCSFISEYRPQDTIPAKNWRQ